MTILKRLLLLLPIGYLGGLAALFGATRVRLSNTANGANDA
jgi:hypothetical protein